MVAAAATVGYTLGLLLLCTYVFAIALRNLVPDNPWGKNSDGTLKGPPEDFEADCGYLEESALIDQCPLQFAYMSNVWETMHSLIVFATFLDDLSNFVIPLLRQSLPCFILSWIYIALSSLTIMNMLIGVLCEVISAVAAEEKESMIVDK